MRIEWHEATGCPAGQFVVYAESMHERALLKMFITFPDYAKDKWVFGKHGSGWSKGGIISFNFGYKRMKEEKE